MTKQLKLPRLSHTRRSVLGIGAAALTTSLLGTKNSALAGTEGRVLKICTLPGYSAVNVPMQAAFRTILPTMPGYATPELQRTAKIPQIVQQVLSGGAEMGDGDVASTMAAAEAGSDIRIIGLSYNNISQVVVINGDRHDSMEALAKKGGVIAVSGIGDFMYVMLRGVLKKRNIDASKINFIELGSSGDRIRALLAGRVDAIPLHVEDVGPAQKQGNYPVAIRPWEEYDNWFSAVTMARASWLKSDENKAAAVAVLKSGLKSFRQSNNDFAWFKAQTHLYASLDYLRDATEETLRPVWQTLSQVAHTFPPNMETMTVDEFAKVLPVYKETGALKGTVDLHSLIDRTYLEQAIKELA